MKKILVLNHFPTVYPPTSGGTLRYFHLYQHLSRYYDMTLLSQSYRKHREVLEFSPTFREYRVEVDDYHKRLSRKLPVDQPVYESGIILLAKLSKYPTVYSQFFHLLSQSCDLIIHESPYLLGYDKGLGKDRKPRVYNSHNHEFVLANRLWKSEQSRQFLPVLFQWEKRLVNNASLVFTTSEAEKHSFISMYQVNPSKIKLAPNGINPTEWIPRNTQSEPRTKALFIGAHYPPNIEAADFIINRLAERCPGVDFIIAGGCCTPFLRQRKSNVQLLGTIDHETKRTLFSQVDIAINPMFTGTGVNVKTLEFLSAGIPLFSTRFGARGLNLVDQIHYIRAEKENFPNKLNQFIQNKGLLKKVVARGQKLINTHFSWGQIATNIMQEIKKVIP